MSARRFFFFTVAATGWVAAVALDAAAAPDAAPRTLTFAHTHLERGVRQAFDALARDYEAVRPGVTVRQLAVPARVYSSWALARLVGRDAPDIMQITRWTSAPEVLVRYFEPLGDPVDAPNPHNAGTVLEGLAWRDTFVDGLSWPPSYSLPLFEVYGVSLGLSTARVFCNRELLRTITGSDRTPRDFQDFIRLCERVREYSRRTGRKIVPLAGSKWNTELILGRMFESQTRRLALRSDRLHQLLAVNPDRMLQFFHGNVTLDTPEFRRGLTLVRAVAQQLQPGFWQVEREDGLLFFLQERALMIVAGSQDFETMSTDARFPVGVFELPVPLANDPEFGRFAMGLDCETQTSTHSSFGISLDSANPDLALDFLRFVTARPQVEKFVRLTCWLPAQIDAPLPDGLGAFRPRLAGYPPGLQLTPGYARLGAPGANSEVELAIARHLHLLVSPQGSVEAFVDALRPEYAHAHERLRRRGLRDRHRQLAYYDASIAALVWQMERDPERQAAAAHRFLLALDNECQWDLMTYWQAHGTEPEFTTGLNDDPLFEEVARLALEPLHAEPRTTR